MENIGDTVLGYKRRLLGFREVKAKDYFLDNFEIDIDNLDGEGERKLARIGIDLSMEEAKFTNYVIRYGLWTPSRYMDNSTPGIWSEKKFNYENVENQLKAPYMRRCERRWLENCLAHNALKVLGLAKKSSDSSNNI